MYPKLRKPGACWSMHTDIGRTLAAIEKCLTGKGEPTQTRLHRMYDLTWRQGTLLWFKKAFVSIKIITPKGSM